jgi:hypothetical protein
MVGILLHNPFWKKLPHKLPYSIIRHMGERKSFFSKRDALRSLRINLVEAKFSTDRVSQSTFEVLADKNESLAREMGATDFEIADVYFSATPKETRQDLLSTYCGRLRYNPESFDSFEKLIEWGKDMKRIQVKYKLRDPLKPEKGEDFPQRV